MKIKMTLLSDAILGNGLSIPAAEDISILCDSFGFPYYKAGTLKGIFREELLNYLIWKGLPEAEIEQKVKELLGESGDSSISDKGKLRFSDLYLSENVRNIIKKEKLIPENILEAFSCIRTFTAIDESGMVKKGSLRSARCLNQGLIFYGSIECEEEQEDIVRDILSLIKWIGTMRNRGFGNVCIEEVIEGRK